MAEIVERLSGMDFCDFVSRRVAEPLGLPNLRMGICPQLGHLVAELTYAGEPMTAEDAKRFGIDFLLPAEINEDTVLGFNKPEVLEAGCPGGGAVATAEDLALFYQALVNGGRAHDGTQIWHEDLLRDVLRIRTEVYIDPIFRIPPNRCLGLNIAGDDGKRAFAALARPTRPSPSAITASAVRSHGLIRQLAFPSPIAPTVWIATISVRLSARWQFPAWPPHAPPKFIQGDRRARMRRFGGLSAPRG
jgi:CubicO group peptidase (beta-lactamase class C family)